MRLDDYRTSDNVRDDGEGSGGGGGFGGGGGGMIPLLLSLVGSRFGIVGIVVVVGAMLLFGGNPLALVGGGQQAVPSRAAPTRATAAQACASDPAKKFSCQVLASTEDTWGRIFQAQGQRYAPATLVFYKGGDHSGCGAAQSAMGPFYCPTDRSIYLDTGFFRELKDKYGAPGNFAEAYVVAHEVGHHVQDMLGILGQARDAQARMSPAQANAEQVLVELQADCFAGVWAANNRDRIEPGDVEGGLRAAHAIGDDTLQQEAQGRVVPDSFTHGTSAERMKWLKRGIDSGDPARCDTFKVGADGWAPVAPGGLGA